MKKLIFSRKGMDAKYGGVASPYVPGEALVSFPIPSAGRKADRSDADLHRYADIRAGTETLEGRLRDLVGDRSAELPRSGKVGPVWTCHHDPDLDVGSRPRSEPASWRASLGQMAQAQGHLQNHGVDSGDIFLFFGWFRRAERDDQRRLRFTRRARNLHVMFGYLQVGEVLPTAGRVGTLPKWLHDHPHLLPKRVDEPSNVIYVAADRLSLEPTLPGAGVFTASPAEGNDTLVLTAPDRSRSWWKLPRHVFGTRPFSFHSEDSWQGGEFRSASIGQEFVVDADDLVRGWVTDVIRTGMRP